MPSSKIVSRGKYIVYGIILFVIIAAAVISGILAGNKLVSTGKLGLRTIKPSQLVNRTLIKLEQEIPYMPIVEPDGKSVEFDSILTGHKTVIGFVSDNCDACHKFVEQFSKKHFLPGNCRLILISATSKNYINNYNSIAFEIYSEFLDDYSIHIFPTIMGVNEKGITKFVSSGYTPLINSDFLKKNLE